MFSADSGLIFFSGCIHNADGAGYWLRLCGKAAAVQFELHYDRTSPLCVANRRKSLEIRGGCNH
ncbi:hypothetical protein D3C87_2052100 [compost metagenome]